MASGFAQLAQNASLKPCKSVWGSGGQAVLAKRSSTEYSGKMMTSRS